MSFLRNRKGQLLTLDLLLALVPLTIILGMSATAMGGVINQIQEYSFFYSTQRQAADAADVLVKTPGVPQDWNSTNPPSILGLAKYNNETNETLIHQLDYEKIAALQTSYLTQLFNFTYYNLTLENTAGFVSYYKSWSNGSRGDASNIVVVERSATFPVFYIDSSSTDSGDGPVNYTTEIYSSDDVYATQTDQFNWGASEYMEFDFPDLGIPSGSQIDSVIVLVEHHESDTSGSIDSSVYVWDGSSWDDVEDYAVSSSDTSYVSQDLSDEIDTASLANDVRLRMYYDPSGDWLWELLGIGQGDTFYADYATISVTYTYDGVQYQILSGYPVHVTLEVGM